MANENEKQNEEKKGPSFGEQLLAGIISVLNQPVVKDLGSAYGKALVAKAETAVIIAKSQGEIALVNAKTANVVAETEQAKAKAELRKVEALAPLELEIALAEARTKLNKAKAGERKSEQELSAPAVVNGAAKPGEQQPRQ